MCCLFTFHGGTGRLSHCCIKKGKHLYQKNDVGEKKNLSFATIFMLSQSDLLTSAQATWGGLSEGLGFFLQSQQLQKIGLDFYSLPLASSNRTVSSIANVEF